ncbi:MAG TPA: ROK family protein [Candidatus Saccharimonadales bacterium]|jgi:glucokinase
MLIAVDTGGTKTLVTGFTKAGKPGAQHRFLTPKSEDEYLATLIEHLQDTYSSKTLDGIVVGVPGVVRDGAVAWGGSNLPWERFDIARPLTRTFDCPVWVENDANLAGVAEARALDPVPRSLLYVTVSTGIGTGIILDGQLAPGLSASEGGHVMVEYDGRVQLWEDFASGQAIKRTYGKYARDITDKAVWNQIADKISRGLIAIIPILQPDCIVIGGSIGTYFNRYDDTLNKLLHEHLPAHITQPLLRQALHPEEAVVYGCYYYGHDQLVS